MKKVTFAGAFVLALALGLTTQAQNQNTVAQPVSTGTTTPESPMKVGGSTGKDLTISAAKSANHTILFRALRLSGLTEQSSSKGPFTVFAPTNDAFDKLPAGTVDELFKPQAKKQLVQLLASHVVKGKYPIEQLQDGQKLKTVTGGTLTVAKQGDQITITDSAGNTATIQQADVEATNGLIHSVDSVLMPTSGK